MEHIAEDGLIKPDPSITVFPDGTAAALTVITKEQLEALRAAAGERGITPAECFAAGVESGFANQWF